MANVDLRQSASNTSVIASVAATFTNIPQAGNLLIAAVNANVSAGSVTISGFTSAVSQTVGAAGSVQIFYKVSAGTETTITASGTLATLMDLHIFEYVGINNVSPLDKTASTADGGSGVTSRASGTTATLSQANELAFACVGTALGNGGGASWTNSFNAEITTTDLISSDIVVSATTALSTTGSWTTSQRAAGLIATFFAETGDSYAPKWPLKPLTPIINWNNPVTKGIFFCAPFFERGGNNVGTRDIAGRLLGPITGAKWVTDIFGSALSFAGGVATDNTNFAVSTTTQRSTMVLFQLAGAVDSTSRRISTFIQSSNICENILLDTTNLFQYQVGWTTATGNWKISNPTTNVWHHLIITYDGSSTSNAPKFYLDGVPQTVTLVAGPTGTLRVGTKLYIGNRDDLVRCFNGFISNYVIWNRILNVQEVKQLYANPWSIYVNPRLPNIYI